MPDFSYPYDPANFVPPSDWRPRSPRRWVLWAILGGFGLWFAVVDFSFCWVGSGLFPSRFGELWMSFNVGAVGAQGGLLAIYAVWGPHRIWRRHLIALALGSVCLLAWLLGYFLAAAVYDTGIFPFPNVEQVCAAMLVIPAMFCAGCVPLWILRTLFRWQIELQPSEAGVARPPQLSIAGILAATSAVAVTLAFVRLGAYISHDPIDGDWWLGTGVAVAVAGCICLATLPPATWGVLRARFLPAGIFVAAIWMCVVTFGLVTLIRITDGRWPPPEAWPDLVLFIASFIFFLFGPLVVGRFFGCRLVVGRRQPSAPRQLPLLPVQMTNPSPSGAAFSGRSTPVFRHNLLAACGLLFGGTAAG